jgi:hypothetical protein
MDSSRDPLAELEHKELVWLFGILKDACRERLEKNLVSQVFEDRLNRRGGVEGRMDPRPFLRIWEPRYRKFLDIATEIHLRLQGEDALEFAETLRDRFNGAPAGRRGSPKAGAETPGRRDARSRKTQGRER